MSEKPELELTADEVPRKREPRFVWHLATNQLNMMFLLAAGLVTGPRDSGASTTATPCPSRQAGFRCLQTESPPARWSRRPRRQATSKASLPPST